MVPLTARAVYPRDSLWRGVGRRLGLVTPVHEVLYPSAAWPSRQFFWDLVAERLRSMARPYLSLAVRTDHHDFGEASRIRQLFDALPAHPLARLLHFVDPLEVASSLLRA
jgi:hypothetical protein